MKVLHVIPSVAQRDGGPARAVTGMCRALESLGVEAVIATTDADGPARLRDVRSVRAANSTCIRARLIDPHSSK